MLRRIRDMRDRAPAPPPSAEDNARAYLAICRAVIALINDNKLVDGAHGFTPAEGLSDFWDVIECRDRFLVFVAPWWWDSGMGQRPAGDLDCQSAYNLAFEIATILEKGLAQEIRS